VLRGPWSMLSAVFEDLHEGSDKGCPNQAVERLADRKPIMFEADGPALAEP
jgi:hypothetical protein